MAGPWGTATWAWIVLPSWDCLPDQTHRILFPTEQEVPEFFDKTSAMSADQRKREAGASRLSRPGFQGGGGYRGGKGGGNRSYGGGGGQGFSVTRRDISVTEQAEFAHSIFSDPSHSTRCVCSTHHSWFQSRVGFCILEVSRASLRGQHRPSPSAEASWGWPRREGIRRWRWRLERRWWRRVWRRPRRGQRRRVGRRRREGRVVRGWPRPSRGLRHAEGGHTVHSGCTGWPPEAPDSRPSYRKDGRPGLCWVAWGLLWVPWHRWDSHCAEGNQCGRVLVGGDCSKPSLQTTPPKQYPPPSLSDFADRVYTPPIPS